jgi:hypothetical protein
MATSTVTTTDAAWAAVKAATAGDTIVLATGNYGVLTLSNFSKAQPGVTVKAGGPVVLDGLVVNGSQGLSFEGFEIALPQPKGQYAVQAVGSSQLAFRNLQGHSADLSLGGVGIFVRDCSDLTMEACAFHHLGVGVGLMDSQRVSLTDTDIHDLGADGVDIAGCSNCVLDGVRVHDLRPTVDADGSVSVHPDAFQFWSTAKNALGVDNVIRNCSYVRGSAGAQAGFGGAAQGIFAESQQNLQVVGNALVGTLLNGISFSTCVGGLIQGNLVQGYEDYGARIIVRGGSSDVAVKDNTATAPVVLLHQAGEADPVRPVVSGTTVTANARVGDASALDAWLAQRSEPPPLAEPDPKDAQIAALTVRAQAAEASLADTQGKLSDALTQLAAAGAALNAEQARVAAARTALEA